MEHQMILISADFKSAYARLAKNASWSEDDPGSAPSGSMNCFPERKCSSRNVECNSIPSPAGRAPAEQPLSWHQNWRIALNRTSAALIALLLR